jgi:hypothetical protein
MVPNGTHHLTFHCHSPQAPGPHLTPLHLHMYIDAKQQNEFCRPVQLRYFQTSGQQLVANNLMGLGESRVLTICCRHSLICLPRVVHAGALPLTCVFAYGLNTWMHSKFSSTAKTGLTHTQLCNDPCGYVEGRSCVICYVFHQC